MAQAVYEDLVFYDFEAKDAEDVIRKLGAHLEKNGFVKDTYIDAVAVREKEYPTGLNLDGAAVAMPHTSGTHVIKPAVLIARLKDPVTFLHMGDSDTRVNAEFIFMMAILDPNDQILLLQKMMQVFTDKQILSEFVAADNRETLSAVAQKFIQM
ncbi:MAG TPA: PTS sugar transporter subunit IIA [Anaerovoracaceae bacterium]|nr:PTS sugar transporter subunit IIA [Anaerovoracaceae bacterium]